MANRRRLLVALAAIVVALPIALVAVNNQTAMAQAIRLEIMPDGGGATAGTAFDITVTAYDASDNIDTTYSGTVAFSSSDPAAILPSQYNFKPSDSGQRAFSITLATKGMQWVMVSDTGGGILSDTAFWSVSAGSPYRIVVSPPTASITAGETRAYTAEAFDQFNNSIGDVTSATGFSTPPGAGGSWDGSTYTSQYPGDWTVTGNYLGMIDTAALTVNPGPADHIIISPNATNIIAGSTQAYTAEAFDQFNNSLGDVTSSTTFTIEPGAGGLWAGSEYTSQIAGTWTVTGDYSGKTDAASLTVNAGPADHIVISPATANVTAGSTQAYTATAFDQFNNSLGDVTSSTTFSIESGAGGLWAGDNPKVYTSEKSGTWTVTATHSGKTGSASLTVEAALPDHIVIFPDTATVIAGATQAYTATAYDQFNNFLGDVTASITFSIEAGAGGDWDANVYTSASVGTWTVTGSFDQFSANATLTVVASAVDHIVISPDNATVSAGGIQAYTAEGFDQFNNSLGDVTTSTSFLIDPGAGGSWTNNVYSSQYAGTWTVSGSHLGLTDSASLTVTAKPAQRLVITTDTTSITAGTPLDITVTAFDAYGNTATGYTGTISFTSSDPGATLPVSYTFAAADNGVHIFSIILATSGSRSVTVTDTVNTALTDSESWTVVDTASNPPNQPANVSPANGAISLSLTPILQSSPFSDPDSGNTHAASQWQITTTQGNYASPIFDSGTDASDLTTISVPAGRLAADAVYYWRVRHQDNHGTWSAWSNQTSFVTSAAHLITPAGGQVQTADGKITAVFPSGAVNVPVMVSIEGVPHSAVFGLPDGFELADTCFSVEALDESAAVFTALTQPVAITVYYTTADASAADGKPESLVLAYRDEVAKEWKILATTVDTVDMTLRASTTHLSTWAVLVPSPSEDKGGTPVWIWIVAILVILLVGAIILWRSVSIRVERQEPPWR